MSDLPEPRIHELAGADREKALVDLIRLDYDATLRTMSSVLATATAVRAAGFATWGVLLGLGAQAESWSFCAISAVALVLFGYLDLLHASIYRRGLRRAIEIEELLDGYLNRLGIDHGYEEAVLRTVARLETHRFGIYRTMRKLRTRDFVRPRPPFLYLGVYPTLLAISIGTGVLVGI